NSNAIWAVPGFGPVLTSELLGWRSSIEQRFVFNAAQGVDPADRDAVEKEITATRIKIEQEMRSGSAQLRQISLQIKTARDTMKPIVEESLKGVTQAELDAGDRTSATLTIAPVLLAFAASLISIMPLKAKLAGDDFGFNSNTKATRSTTSATPSTTSSQRQSPVSTPTPSIEQLRAEAELRYEEGLELTKARRYQDAVSAYQQAIILNPDFAEAYHELGFAFFKLGKYEESVASSQQAIKLKPDNSDTYRNLGLAYQALRRWKAAMEAFTKSLKIKPGDAATHYNLGLVLKNNNDIDAAIESFKETIKIKPDFALAHYELGLAYTVTDEPQLANEEYNILSSLNPKLAEKLLKKITTSEDNANVNTQP